MSAAGHDELDQAACLRLLGLPDAASAREIKRAYRRLAQRFHPDKTGSDEAARRHFEAISNAYRRLMQTARLVERGTPVGRCCACRQFGEVILGLDGLTRCPVCALRPGGRPLLPLPVFTVVGCASVIALLAGSVLLLLASVAGGSAGLAAAGAGAGLLALLVLAGICLRVVYYIQPNEEHARRTGRRDGAGSRCAGLIRPAGLHEAWPPRTGEDAARPRTPPA